jgi:hypothetical protein
VQSREWESRLGTVGQKGANGDIFRVLTEAERLRAEVDADHARQRSQIMALQDEISELLERMLAGRATPTTQIDQIPDPKMGGRFVNVLLRLARREIAQIRTRHADMLPDVTVGGLRRRGVRIRAIYPVTVLGHASAARQLRVDQAEGTEVRIVPRPPTEMTILDRRVAVITTREVDSVVDNSWVVRGEAILQPLSALFDTYWQLAREPPKAVTGQKTPGANGPTQDDRLLLDLLSQGLKDEAMAHHLGVSVRTVRRRISDLMHRLGACSRFQIGVLAERRGWLEPVCRTDEDFPAAFSV